MSWRNLTLTVRGRDADALSDALIGAGALAVDVSDADAGTAAEQAVFAEPHSARTHWEHTRVSALFASGADVAGALANACRVAAIAFPPAFETNEVADCDWVRLTQSQFEPIRVSSRLWIVPSWAVAPDPDAINIVLDPGVAFGTGSHPTTRLCLQWLEENIRGGESVLDYGCGSGILAITAARLGAAHVSGFDIDPQAVLAARANAMQNRVAADFHEPGAVPAPLCDIVVANILAGPLIAIAPLLAQATCAGGRIALSGVLESQCDELRHAYSAWFEMDAAVAAEGWALLTGRRTRKVA